METAQAVAPTVAAGWRGSLLGAWVGGSYQRVRRFITDHRKGLLCLAVTGGVAAYAVYRVGREYREVQEASLHRLRLRGAFESTQSTCAGTVGSLVLKLNDAVLRLVPIPSPAELRLSLQQAPKDGQDRYALWDHCKTQTFARLVVGVYGVVLLSTFLRVQVNILGRYLYLETLIATDPSARFRIPLDVAIPQDTQKRYLGYSEYVVHTGLPQLVALVQATAQQVLSSYPLQRQCTYEDVLAIVDAIRRKMEQPLSPDSDETGLNTFLLPQEDAEGGSSGGNGKRHRDHKLTMLINETRDVLESPEFNQILYRCLNLSFYAMAHQLHSCFPQQEQHQQEQQALASSVGAARDLTTAATAEPALPMAKLMPLVNKQVSQLLASDPNPFLDTVLHDDQLRQYAFDLFTAFGADE